MPRQRMRCAPRSGSSHHGIGSRAGPIRSEELLSSTGFIELFRTTAGRRSRAKVGPLSPTHRASDAPCSRVHAGRSLRPGTYELEIDSVARAWVASHDCRRAGRTRNTRSSSAGESGFRWKLQTRRLSCRGQEAQVQCRYLRVNLVRMPRRSYAVGERTNFLLLASRTRIVGSRRALSELGLPVSQGAAELKSEPGGVRQDPGWQLQYRRKPLRMPKSPMNVFE